MKASLAAAFASIDIRENESLRRSAHGVAGVAFQRCLPRAHFWQAFKYLPNRRVAS